VKELAARPVDALAWESFGEGWVTDVIKQLKLKDALVLKAPYGKLPDLKSVVALADVKCAEQPDQPALGRVKW